MFVSFSCPSLLGLVITSQLFPGENQFAENANVDKIFSSIFFLIVVCIYSIAY